MRFRLRAFGWHLLASACVMALVFGALYLGWYRWPGWYLSGVLKVAAIIAGVDVVLGPLLTLVIANPTKPRRGLLRDIAVIVAVQIAALVYGASALWHGRPLYYTFSVNRLEMVQASDLSTQEIARGQKQNPDFAPHWYSRPRWVWAPLPSDPKLQEQIMSAAISGGDDVIDMPRYFKPREQGIADLCKQLKAVDAIGDFSSAEKTRLKSRLQHLHIDPAKPTMMVLSGRRKPLLAVFDCPAGKMTQLLRAD